MTNISAPQHEPLPPAVPASTQTSISDSASRRNDSTSSDLRSRYWTFLFDNLKRSIEQLYQTCESDQNPAQCHEVVQYLCQCCKDFEVLKKTFQHLQNLDDEIDEKARDSLSKSLIDLPVQKDTSSFRPFEHSQSISNGELFHGTDLSRRQKRLHNSDMNLTVNNSSHLHPIDVNKIKRQKSTKSRKLPESSSLLSLPSLFSSSTLTNDSSMTLVNSTNQIYLSTKRTVTDETAGDADDEKDMRDESINANRSHRYHHQLSSASHNRLKDQNNTSEDDDEDALLRNHHGMMDFMDRQIFDAFDQEETLTAALQAEQERTIASLMAEQADLEQQLNNVIDDDLLLAGDEGSELEESELSTTKTSSYFMSLQDDREEKDISPIDLSRDDNDSDPDGKSRVRHLRIHEKLSSPSRIRPLSETLREAAERQARALSRRQLLRDEKARKMRELTHRVNEVRRWKEQLIKARKTTIEMKMRRAEEKRQYLLLLKAKKAGDEDLKGQEIAFIKLLQQENRRQTLKERYQKEEQFKQFLEEERVKKHDEHKQRELAAENRRKELEQIRQTRLNEMQEKWKTKERMIEQHLNEKRKQKQSAAIAKQKNFQQKRAERVAHLKATTVELKKKLALKQEESTRRHVSQLEEIRRKAMEMRTLRGPSAEDHPHSSPAPDDSKMTTSMTSIVTPEDTVITRKCCTLCNLLLASDLHLQTHLRGTRHNQLLLERLQQKSENGTKKIPQQEELDAFNKECIAVVTSDDIVRQEMSYSRERKHAMKKRAKKLRLRMAQRAAAYEAENAQRPYLTSTHKARIQRFLNELEKSLNSTARNEPLTTTNYLACQRILTEFVKIFDTHGYEKDSPLEQRVFFTLNGYTTLNKMIELRAECHKPPLAPESLVALAVSVYQAATNNNLDNALYILNSGKILTLVESLVRHITGLKGDDLTMNNLERSESEKLAQIDLVANLAHLLSSLLTVYNEAVFEIRKRDHETNEDKLTVSRVTDLISYMANIGVLDRIASFFRTARTVVNTTKSRLPDMIIHLLDLIQQMLNFSKPSAPIPPFGNTKKSINDPAQVINIMKSTNFCELLSLLYGILVNETDNNNNSQAVTESHGITSLQDKTFTVVNHSLLVLNTLAVLDLDTFQTTLGEETISLQLRHVANSLLAYLHQQQSTANDTLLHQIILLVGYYAVLNQDNQCRLAFGNRPTVLQQLSCLPFRYFVEQKYMDILFPTLIACSFDCNTTRDILKSEMSLDLIVNYIQNKLNDATTIKAEEMNTAFSMRFPRDEWTNAFKYYRPIETGSAAISQMNSSDEDKENRS